MVDLLLQSHRSLLGRLQDIAYCGQNDGIESLPGKQRIAFSIYRKLLILRAMQALVVCLSMDFCLWQPNRYRSDCRLLVVFLAVQPENERNRLVVAQGRLYNLSVQIGNNSFVVFG